MSLVQFENCDFTSLAPGFPDATTDNTRRQRQVLPAWFLTAVGRKRSDESDYSTFLLRNGAPHAKEAPPFLIETTPAAATGPGAVDLVFQYSPSVANLPAKIFGVLKAFNYIVHSATPTRSPFQELERRDDTEGAISQLEQSAQVPWREQIARRLFELLEDYRDENDGKSFSALAVHGLRSFLESHSFLKRPSLSITNAGSVYARWKQDSNSIFSANFISDQEVEFVLFRPQSDQIRTVSGKCSPFELGTRAEVANLPWVRP